MPLIPSQPAPSADDVSTFQQVQQHWNSGNQTNALDLLRPKAEDGRAWAAALMAWLTMQQGAPGIEESINWAVNAARLGIPGQAVHTFNHAIGQVANNPQIVTRLPELFPWAFQPTGGFDPVGQAWNLFAQGQPELGLQIMTLPIAWPMTDPQWESVLAQASTRLHEISELAEAARRDRAAVGEVSQQAHDAIQQARDDLQTSANQANLLVTSVTSGAVNELFEADAKRNSDESKAAWRVGLGVLAAAALMAVLPVILHYLHWGPPYSTIEQIGIHLTSTAALASFAGVLLARARSRDRAAQRARDLSTAMGTMISYSSQITDPGERQRFMTIMGRTVLQAHLTVSSGSGGGGDDSATQMLNAAGLLKTLTNSSSTAQS